MLGLLRQVRISSKIIPKTSRAITRNVTSFAAKMAQVIEQQKLKEVTAKAAAVPYKSRYNGKGKKRQWEYTRRDETDTEKKLCQDGTSVERVKRKKSILLLGYSGVNYFGMQRNPEMKTIEEELFKAMHKIKWISDEGFNQAQQVQFQRAARTDKGVSAARQCVSLKLPEDLDLAALNAELPEDIKAFTVRRVTKGFNSKDLCNARTYTYTLPTVAFAKHDECVDMSTYRIPTETIDRVNELLKRFEGTKAYHNFTCRKEHFDPSSKRFIISFECGTPFLVDDTVEFVVLKVKGQSFMMHQIRKMVGLLLAIARGHTNVEIFNKVFTELRIDMPMVPGLGLVLDQVHYDRYNQRYGEDGVHKPLTWTDEEPTITAFIEKHIYPTIVETEIRDKSMVVWLETLAGHNFAVRDRDKDEQQQQLQQQPLPLASNESDDNE